MTQEEFDSLYTKIYDAYADSFSKDEYLQSTLEDAMDHLLNLQETRKLQWLQGICPD